ncbi:MAG: transglycosylase domain-containing protein [Ahniella sp.]|nr:transglycosylase domain-containing protein [Ahniella sp.]
MRRIGRWLLVTALLSVLLLCGWRLLPQPSWQQTRPQSTRVASRDGVLLRLTLASDERYRLWVPHADYPPQLIDALLLKEERWYHWHPGVNPVSVARALAGRLTDAESDVGASTLTMQLARIESGLNTRSYGGKARQMGRALSISASHDKAAVLEAYLNLAPMAGNVEGFGTASLVYFGKSAADLNLVEILTLAVLPQRPQLQAHAQGLQLTRFGHAARARLFDAWVKDHPEHEQFRSQIEAVTVLRRPSDLPFRAPHAVDQALRTASQRGALPARLVTTIDLRQQQILERELARYLDEQARMGFRNGSVLLVDAVDGEIRALVGSADYFDPSISGQINGTAIHRSPGSTLKPLLYGLAIDQGQIHPASVLRDVPTRFGPFSPENFDGEFVGPITAQEALVRSRNIPAVQIASRLGQPNLYSLLKAAQVADMARESHYGLSLVLGGGALSAQELAGLYGMLGRQGRHRRLGLIEGDAARESS